MNFILAVISAIVLFLYGLQAFTREIQAVGGETLKDWLGRLTSNPVKGVRLGAFATAIVQSSSAVVALAISLVDAGILTFRSSLGVVLTALVQSSTIVTGLSIVMVQQSVLTAQAAIPIVIGTNIGTTLKGLLITIGMKGAARRVAVANICFNVIGVLLLVPFLRPFAAAMANLSHDPGISVAWAQFLFNLGMTLIGLVLIRAFRDWLPDVSGEALAV